jgi:hypothetical protein
VRTRRPERLADPLRKGWEDGKEDQRQQAVAKARWRKHAGRVSDEASNSNEFRAWRCRPSPHRLVLDQAASVGAEPHVIRSDGRCDPAIV